MDTVRPTREWASSLGQTRVEGVGVGGRPLAGSVAEPGLDFERCRIRAELAGEFTLLKVRLCNHCDLDGQGGRPNKVDGRESGLATAKAAGRIVGTAGHGDQHAAGELLVRERVTRDSDGQKLVEV